MENVFGAIFPWSRAWWEIAAPSRILQPFFQASHRCIFSHGPKASHLIRPVVLVESLVQKSEPNWQNYMTIVAIVVSIQSILQIWDQATSGQSWSGQLTVELQRASAVRTQDLEHCSMIPSSTPFVLLGICKVGIEHGLALLVELTEPRGNLSATWMGVPVVRWFFEHVLNGVQMFHLPIFFGGMCLIHLTTLNKLNFKTLAKSGWFVSTTRLLPLPVRP